MPMYKKTNGILAVALVLGLGISLAPVAVFGAYNDVTLTTDTVISVGGYNLSVSGSSAVVESITVNASNFSFVLLPYSLIQFTSADGRLLGGVSASGEEFEQIQTCVSTTDAETKFTPVSTLANTITVSLTSSTCVPVTVAAAGERTGSASGRGGGGGGGNTTPTPTPTAPVAVPAIVTTGQSSFTRLLSVGSTGDDVRNLQTQLLSEGVYNGPVTGYFGPLTQAGVKAYQAKYGIDQLGIVGPATRAQLNKIVTANAGSNAAATSQLTPAQVSAIMSQINTLLQQVQILQAKLKALGN